MDTLDLALDDLVVLPPPAPADLPSGPSIVYESDLVTVVHGRAEDYLPMVPRESVGLVIADPPYGREWESNRRAESFGQLDGDGADTMSRERLNRVIGECVRIVGQQRHLYVFGPEDVLAGHKVSDVVELIWDKVSLGSGDVTSVWSPNHERINFTVSKHRHAGKAGKPTLPTRMRRGSVLRYQRPTGKAVRHPDEKPVALLRELIESSSKQGETVLDPTAGVLSTAVAAVLTGRRALVIESDLRWIEKGLPRIRAAEALAAQMTAL